MKTEHQSDSSLKATISFSSMMSKEDGQMKKANSTTQMVYSSMKNPLMKKTKVISMTMILLMNSNKCSSKSKKASSDTNPRMTRSKQNPLPHRKPTTNKNPKNTLKSSKRKSNSEKDFHPWFGSSTKWDPTCTKEFNIKSKRNRIRILKMPSSRKSRPKLKPEENIFWNPTSGFKEIFHWSIQETLLMKEFMTGIGTGMSRPRMKISFLPSKRLRKAKNSRYLNQKLYSLLSQSFSLKAKWNKQLQILRNLRTMPQKIKQFWSRLTIYLKSFHWVLFLTWLKSAEDFWKMLKKLILLTTLVQIWLSRNEQLKFSQILKATHMMKRSTFGCKSSV